MCDCIKQTLESLRDLDENTTLVLPMVVRIVATNMKPDISRRMLIATEKINPKKKAGPIKLFAAARLAARNIRRNR